MSSLAWVENRLNGDYTPVSAADARAALEFWRGAPFYAPSPLVSLPGLASELGVGALCVKDEGRRFGPGSFKLMGAGYAMSRVLGAGSWQDAVDARRRLTFYTATDGNHGRAVSWCAKRMGQRAVVLMPAGSSRERFDAIAAEGASVTITDMNYDDCVRSVRAMADAEEGGVLLQDTTQPGYEDIPLDIMRGYGALVAELASQLPWEPTHVILQAGVGSFAGAASSAFTELFPDARAVFIVCETAAAPCLMLSAGAGEVRKCGGDIRTIMAGLACGEPCLPGLKSLTARARFFAALTDDWAAGAMRALAHPSGGDEAVTAGESGAAGLGLLLAMARSPELAALRDAAGINQHSRVLVFNTETATNMKNYARLVGNFAGHPSSKDV